MGCTQQLRLYSCGFVINPRPNTTNWAYFIEIMKYAQFMPCKNYSSLASCMLFPFGVAAFVRILAVGSLHELFQLFFKGQVPGRGSHCTDFLSRAPNWN